eukprot:279161_1
MTTFEEIKSNENKTQDSKADDIIPIKPTAPQNVKLYLMNPERFVIEWSEPKKCGLPFPLYYDIVINDIIFSKAVIQHKQSQSNNKKAKKRNIYRLLVENCDQNETFQVHIDTYNDKLKGNSTHLHTIKTIQKPSVIQELKMENGIITWIQPEYQSFGNLIYELIDANDIEEHSILQTTNCSINIHEQYKDNIEIKDDIENGLWRIKAVDIKCGHHSFSPVISYNIGDIKTTKFTAAKLWYTKKRKKIKLAPLQYPKWEPPPKPKVLQDINSIQLIDKGTYMLIPTELDNTKDNVLTVMVFSDTHNKHQHYRFDKLPAADIIIHCGDFTMDGREYEVEQFAKWGEFLGQLNIDETKNKQIYERYYDTENDEIKDEIIELDIKDRKYKHLICIAGNHEMTFDLKWYNGFGTDAKRRHKDIKQLPNAETIKSLILDSKYWIYLEDSCINLYGLNIYGSPWQPCFFNWAFQLNRGEELKNKWNLIPNDTNILITHGPPFCHGDKRFSLKSLKSERAKGKDNREYLGDEDLMNRVKEINNIDYHIFGHVHLGVGCTIQKGIKTTFINASSVDGAYQPENKPICFYINKKK